MNAIENKLRITKPATEERVTVTAWPDEIQLEVHARNGNLTVQEALDLIGLLKMAVDLAARLDFSDDDEPRLVLRDEDPA